MMIPLPDILNILERPHYIMMDAEKFWSDLSISLSYYKNKDEGHDRTIGVKWKYNTVPSLYFKNILPDIVGKDVDWTTISFVKTKEEVVIFHYCIPSDEKTSLKICVGVISDTSLPVAKLRLIGDQIIQKKFKNG